MSNQATVTYLYHSGFLVSVEDTLLVFDYWEGDNRSLPLRARITERDFEPYRRVFVFVSHNHADHFDEVIYTWDRAKYNITYIVSYDIPTGKRGKRMAPGDVANYDRMEIRAFDSTDKGVSWYVDLDGVRIFHAGDLNLWHWHEVSTVRQVKQAEDDFYAACAPIIELPIDLCMFPLDPRLGGMYDAGINYFVMAAKPRVVIPMHWQERTEVPASYVRQAGKEIPYTEVLALIQPRERADLTFGDVELQIHVHTPASRLLEENDDDKQTTPTDDPFADTDLPVDIRLDRHD